MLVSFSSSFRGGPPGSRCGLRDPNEDQDWVTFHSNPSLTFPVDFEGRTTADALLGSPIAQVYSTSAWMAGGSFTHAGWSWRLGLRHGPIYTHGLRGVSAELPRYIKNPLYLIMNPGFFPWQYCQFTGTGTEGVSAQWPHYNCFLYPLLLSHNETWLFAFSSVVGLQVQVFVRNYLAIKHYYYLIIKRVFWMFSIQQSISSVQVQEVLVQSHLTINIRCYYLIMKRVCFPPFRTVLSVCR